MARTRWITALLAAWIAGPGALPAPAQTGAQNRVTARNWGGVTAPVYGTTETGALVGAELLAGPKKFDGNYFHGVLPNGRIVRPAGISVQVGMNPLGEVLTPDGKYLIVTNDDERDVGTPSRLNAADHGGYSLSVLDTQSMAVVSATNTQDRFFVGLQVTGRGPYQVWASGGPDNDVKLFSVSPAGTITAGAPAAIAIPPLLKAGEGYVSHYTPAPVFHGPTPTGWSKTGDAITFPAGSALSPNGRFLYVACNGDNSLAVIDTRMEQVVQHVAVGFFPYGVSVSRDGTRIFVSNWGIMAYRFAHPAYDTAGNLTSLGAAGVNEPDGYYLPRTSASGPEPQTSSVSLLQAAGGDGSRTELLRSVFEGHTLNALDPVGDTHPSATVVVRHGGEEVLYVTRTNSDSLALIRVADGRSLPSFDLSPLHVPLADRHLIHGASPDALAASPDGTRLYVAEADLNAVDVLDTTVPSRPRLLGRIGTGWYPTALTISGDGKTLYVVNAKGIGEDIARTAPGAPEGPASPLDSNFLFGSVQKIPLDRLARNPAAVLRDNYALHLPADTRVVPVGGGALGPDQACVSHLSGK